MKKKSTNRSAFFNTRTLLGVVVSFAGVGLALFAFSKASAQPGAPQAPTKQNPMQAQYRGLMQVVKFDVSPPLRQMQPIFPGTATKNEEEELGPIPVPKPGARFIDPVVQSALARSGQPAIPDPFISFDAYSNSCGCSPPDPNGAVGPNHVVAVGNLHFQIFNKSGASLFGPAANNTLWSGFGGGCQTRNDGDPVVIYDQLADRWLISQFTAAAPYLQCVALSQTNDPTGAYYRWSFAVGGGSNFGDYPKAGMWPDAYYFSTREFAGGTTFVGVGAYAFNRSQALVGNPNPQVISFLAPPSPAYVVGDGLLPSDLEGMTPPPAGSPNFYIGSEDPHGGYGAPQNALTVWKFHADFNTPANSFFTLTNTLPTMPFNSILALCGGGRNCVPQPGTANRIDHLGYRQRPLYRAAYRNFGDHEAIVTNQSVSAGTGPSGEVSGIRWWELRGLNTSPSIFQESTYAPGLTDGIHRWMGSMAFNGAGDIALSYSVSSGSVFPGIRYTARHASDPPGQMTLGEGTILTGTGSQTGSQRWGDYTSLTVDPVDDMSFWVVNEYVPTTSSIGWRIRVGAFSLGPTATGAVSRMIHGAAGTFDIAMPLTGASGVECRTAGGTNDYSLVVTFSGNVTVTGSPQSQVTSGTGCVGSGGVCSGNVNVSGAVVTVPLTNIADQQVINVRINGVNSAASDAPATDINIPMGFLIGDTNGNRTVNAADVSQTKARLGQTVDATNFRSDLNANGTINAADTAQVKQNSGHSIP
jgi:hypothetical protein